MTIEEMLGVAEIVERATNRFNEQAARFREKSAAYDRLIAEMNADHERKLTEHRASFGARTEADRQIIEGMRRELFMLTGLNDKLIADRDEAWKERDSLLVQVQDQCAEIERLRNDERKAYQDGEALRAEVADLRGIVDMVHASLGIKQGDHIGKAIEALKAQTPTRSHPVAVGGYLRRLTGFGTTPAGEVAQVLHVDCDGPATEYTVKRPNGQQGVWLESGCEPCDPPEASHDTPAGKEAAASVIRDFRSGDTAFSPIEIKGALFDDTKITVRREPDQNHGSRIVISDANDMGEANIYLTESGARQMATALIGLCDVRKVPK